MTYLPLLDHLWQSTLFAAAAGLLTLGLRANRARVRHALWLAASVKFLVPLSFLIGLGTQVHWRPAAQWEPSNLAFAVVEVSEPFTTPQALTPATLRVRPSSTPLPSILAAIWACGVLGIFCAWWIRWRGIRAVVRAGTPVELRLPVPAVLSPSLVEPGVFGVARPVLLLPANVFERLTPEQLNTVIAHELEHVRHRDNLAAAFHMFIETVFWFHPLVWWIGRRMLEERERACDEDVLRAGNHPRVYAEAVLAVCKLYVTSPLACVSGIAGANLKRRIEAIMKKQIAHELHFAKKVALAAIGIVVLAAPVWIGMMHAPAAWAQPPAPPTPPAAPAAPQVHPVVVTKPRAVVAAPVALAPQVVMPPEPQVPAGATPTEARNIRAVYAKANFQNQAMVAAYTWYGPPSQKSHNGEFEIWQYENADLYKGKLTIQFSPRAGARVMLPAQPVFEGGTAVEPAVNSLAKVLTGDTQIPEGSIRSGLPGRHSFIEPSLQVNRAEHFVNLGIPMDTLSGQVDIIAQVTDEFKTVVANVRDKVESGAGEWHGSIVLLPGSYTCHVVLREQSSGLVYAETISFAVAR
jgi:beta-lactamase regulating signal transducer with metallopeptidase domain